MKSIATLLREQLDKVGRDAVWLHYKLDKAGVKVSLGTVQGWLDDELRVPRMYLHGLYTALKVSPTQQRAWNIATGIQEGT